MTQDLFFKTLNTEYTDTNNLQEIAFLSEVMELVIDGSSTENRNKEFFQVVINILQDRLRELNQSDILDEGYF